ncbi:hypothetical protein JS531_03040 [Bifidobacterium sp. CP2]|uniref:DUF2076 domain-containing protein n=1 Tax=Bifidobacterium sp. CP2 TaxID=2809025 RepID=UPI001BDBC1E4|nr:DUF2076 domain-containing protein [Bifidobacterium sp. CP2]MBT1180961.1 hypothetical protein [Bifidobacterium sp. CP2]
MMTVPQQPYPQNPQTPPQPAVPQQPAAPAPTGAPAYTTGQYAQTGQQYNAPAGQPAQPGYTNYAAPQPGYPTQPTAPAQQAPNFLDTLDVAKTTKLSLILMVVFMGIDTLQSFIHLLVGSAVFNSHAAATLIVYFTPWSYLTLAVALFAFGINTVRTLPWYRMAGFIILCAGAGVELLTEILNAVEVYGIGILLLTFLAYGALLAHAVILFMAKTKEA